MTVSVFLNEQHRLLVDQVAVLNEKFGADDWVIVPIPETGWNLEEQKQVIAELEGDVVFASCPPVMVKLASVASVSNYAQGMVGTSLDSPGKSIDEVFVFANDRREKKELPNGKVISVTAQTGWYLA